MNLVEDGNQILFGELEPGTLFKFDDTIALMSEYSEYVTGGVVMQAFIVGSGERFWGGTSGKKDLNNLLVQPLKITGLALC